MDYGRHDDRSDFDNRISMTELQDQYAYTLGVNIEKGEKISGNNDKMLYHAEWIDRNEPPIVLIEKKRNGNSEELLFNLTLAHPHIIKTYGFVDPNGYEVRPNCDLLLQEYARDGDLGDLLSSKHFIPASNVLLEIFIQIADAMIFLAKSNVIHGDLGCRNVLVFKTHPYDPSKNLVKLIDFGLTRNNTGSSNTNTNIPVRFVPPEILRSNGQSGYSEKSDVYAFAAFMHEACSFGKMPYSEINDDNEVWRQKLEGKRLTQPDKCDPNLWKLMNLCWNDQPHRRPTFEQIYKQLKMIQNVESSFASSNSNEEDNSSLFRIEFQICRNCKLRYTDHHSHRQNCSEEEVKCEQCFQGYTRGNYSKHKRSCKGQPDDIPFSEGSKSSSKIGSSISKHNTNNSHRSKATINTSLTNPLYRPVRNVPVNPKPSPTPYEIPKHPRSSNTKPNPSEMNQVQIPCEVCEKLFDESVVRAHQKQCVKKDKERIELRRQEIEREGVPTKAECVYCQLKYLIKELEEHQDKCSSNPKNVSDLRQFLTSTRSNSDPNLYGTFSNDLPPESSTLNPTKRQSFWKSTVNLNARETSATNTNQQSLFQRFLLIFRRPKKRR